MAASVVHSAPGRLRLRINGTTSAERDEVLDALAALTSREGVESVRTDRRTGSALVTWNPESLDLNGAFELVRTAHQALHELLPPPLLEVAERPISEMAAGIQTGLGHADRTVRRATRGTIDLRMLVPVGLAGLSIRQLARTGPQLKMMPWYVLAYYAFDTFIKLHQGLPRVAEAEEEPA